MTEMSTNPGCQEWALLLGVKGRFQGEGDAISKVRENSRKRQQHKQRHRDRKLCGPMKGVTREKSRIGTWNVTEEESNEVLVECSRSPFKAGEGLGLFCTR